MKNQNLLSTNQETKGREEEKKTPNIRTMGSDVSEYAKSKKLSQISIAAEELQRPAILEIPNAENSSSHTTKIIIAILGTLAIIAITASAGVYLYYTVLTKSKSEATKTTTAVYFSSEKLETITLSPQDNLTLKLNTSATDIQPITTIKRLNILLANNAGNQTSANAKDFFRLLRIPAPSIIAGDSDVMPFFYYQDGVARAGFLTPIRDENIALQSMISWEASIQKDLSPLFLQKLPETAAAPFEDKTFKNINYRFMKLSATKDFGIGYFIFPAKNYLVVTTSEAELQSVITRLFEAK